MTEIPTFHTVINNYSHILRNHYDITNRWRTWCDITTTLTDDDITDQPHTNVTRCRNCITALDAATRAHDELRKTRDILAASRARAARAAS